MVSAPVPPVMVSTLATVAEFVALPRVRVSEPPARSMLALAIAPVRLMVSAPEPEVSVSTVLKVAVFAALPRVMMTDTAHLLGTGKPGTGRFVLPPGVAALLRERKQYAADVKNWFAPAAVAAGSGVSPHLFLCQEACAWRRRNRISRPRSG